MLTFAFFCNLAVGTAFTGTVVVQGSHHLRVHATSFATSAVVGELNNGVTVSISCKKAGTQESGSQGSTDQWYLVNSKGYASAAYISTGKVLIPACGPAPPAPSKDCDGPDVSHYQGSIDWTKVHASGVGFAIAKATEGENNGMQFIFSTASLLITCCGWIRSFRYQLLVLAIRWHTLSHTHTHSGRSLPHELEWHQGRRHPCARGLPLRTSGGKRVDAGQSLCVLRWGAVSRRFLGA